MNVRHTILKRLTESGNLAVERIVEAALARESAEGTVALADVLLQRDHRAGWVALVRHFDRLAPQVQRQLLARPRELFGPLADTMEDATARANVIRIVRQLADPKLVFLLAEALMDARPEVREIAGGSLLDAVRNFRHTAEITEGHEADPKGIRKALDFALAQYKTHRQPAAVTAALLYERQQDSATWPLFSDPYSELTRAAALILRQPAEPMLAPALLLALASPLKVAAINGLASADGELAQAVARESYRLLDPVLAAAAEAASHLKALGSIRRDLPWDAESWPGWLRLIGSLGLPPALKLGWLQRMVESPGAPAAQRLMALRAIADLQLPEGQQYLAQLASDPNEQVARFAARCVIARRFAQWKAHGPVLARSPHPSVRALLTMAAGHTKFEKLWSDYQRLPPAMQVAAARELSTAEADFPQRLREKLASDLPAEVVQGLRVLGTLADLRPYRDTIIALCLNPDAHVVSLAIRLVGRLEDPDLLDLLEAAARHADPRVRANAVEAMATLRVAHRSRQVLAMLNSRHSRERANAIKAMSQFDFATARETLIKMLTDANPLHRASALWVVGQLDILEIVRQAVNLARRDGNPHVRARAAELLERVPAVAGVR